MPKARSNVRAEKIAALQSELLSIDLLLAELEQIRAALKEQSDAHARLEANLKRTSR